MKAEAAVLEGLENGLAIAKPGALCGDIAASLKQTLSQHGCQLVWMAVRRCLLAHLRAHVCSRANRAWAVHS